MEHLLYTSCRLVLRRMPALRGTVRSAYAWIYCSTAFAACCAVGMSPPSSSRTAPSQAVLWLLVLLSAVALHAWDTLSARCMNSVHGTLGTGGLATLLLHGHARSAPHDHGDGTDEEPGQSTRAQGVRRCVRRFVCMCVRG